MTDEHATGAIITDDDRARLYIRKAYALATQAHEGQVDKIGEPYIRHPMRVAIAVCDDVGGGDLFMATHPAIQVAYLHDVVEDTDVTLDDLRTMGFSEDVVAAVDAISKRKGEKFSDYYERVKANPLALVVKMHDVEDNADPRRLAKVAPDTRERLREKYEKARKILRGEEEA